MGSWYDCLAPVKELGSQLCLYTQVSFQFIKIWLKLKVIGFLVESKDVHQFKKINARVASIEFNRGSRQETLLVPCYRKSMARMINLEVHIVYEDRQKIMEHPIGLPVLVSAQDLGAQKILLVDSIDQTIIYEASGDQVPGFKFLNP